MSGIAGGAYITALSSSTLLQSRRCSRSADRTLRRPIIRTAPWAVAAGALMPFSALAGTVIIGWIMTERGIWTPALRTETVIDPIRIPQWEGVVEEFATVW